MIKLAQKLLWTPHLSPESQEVGITVALETLARIVPETKSKISCLHEITNKIHDCLTKGTTWIRCILGHLMGRIHDVGARCLSQVVELPDGQSTIEVEIEGWLILECMQVELCFGRDRLLLCIGDAPI